MDPTVDIVFRVIQVVAQAAIALAVFIAGRAIAKAQYTKSAQDCWNEFNKLVLANADNLRVAREHLRPPSFAKSSDDLTRKAYLGFMLLNAFSAYHMGSKYKLVDAHHQDAQLRELLKPIMEDEQIYELSQARGYHPDFRAFCRQVRFGTTT